MGGTQFVSFEDVMNRRRGSAVTLGNSGYRVALCITCRNGAPFALRNLRHDYSWFVCQRPSVHLSADLSVVREALPDPDVAHGSADGIASPKAAQSSLGQVVNLFKIQIRTEEFVVRFH